MLEWLTRAGISPAGSTCVEVGTGHKATLPLLLALCGADSVTTVDLRRRLQMPLMRDLVARVAAREQELTSSFAPFVDPGVVAERFGILRAHRSDPARAIAALGVHYVAPGDAARLAIPDSTVDIHFSTTTLEHIPPPVLATIFAEARRVLRPHGAALHFIDLSDHFAHQDPRITRANFLRFDAEEWTSLAGNEFGFCNRLRAPDYVALFESCGLTVADAEERIDGPSLSALEGGVLVPHDDFVHHPAQTLATDRLRVRLRPSSREATTDSATRSTVDSA